MRTQSVDTDPKIEEMMIHHLRQATIPKRLSRLLSLSSLTLRLSRRALLRTNPNMTKQELDLFFIKIHYDDDFHDKVNNYYQKSNNEKK